MQRVSLCAAVAVYLSAASDMVFAQTTPPSDRFDVDGGTLAVSFLGHGTLMIDAKGVIIHVDPVGRYGKYDTLPKADIILVTHDHGDHLDTAAIAKIRTDATVILANEASAQKLSGANVFAMKNGDSRAVKGGAIEAVPAYNTSADRSSYHPKGRGNGYVLAVGGKRIYIAGDTEDTPEMKALKSIDIAFLPMNLPYTMTPEQVAAAARAFRPKVLYPYHYGGTDPKKLASLLAGESGIEVRIRPLE